jgi:Winged helix-turn helix
MAPMASFDRSLSISVNAYSRSSQQTLSRELRAMGYRKLSARPRHHAQTEGAIEDFKKVSPAPG